MKYFLLRNDRIHGPFSKNQIAKALKSKKVSKADLIATSSSGPWQSVAKTFGLQGSKSEKRSESVDLEKQSDVVHTSSPELDLGDLADFENQADVPVASSFSSASPSVQPSGQSPVTSDSNSSGSAYLERALNEAKDKEASDAAEEKSNRKYLMISGVVALALAIGTPLVWVAARSISTNFFHDALVHVNTEGKISLAVNKKNFMKLQTGMVEDQVKGILGTPTKEKDIGNSSFWTYKSRNAKIECFFEGGVLDWFEQEGIF